MGKLTKGDITNIVNELFGKKKLFLSRRRIEIKKNNKMLETKRFEVGFRSFKAEFRKRKAEDMAKILERYNSWIWDLNDSIMVSHNDSLVRMYEDRLSKLENEKVILERIYNKINK